MIPLATDLSDDDQERIIQHKDNYFKISNAINGRQEKWTPIVYGATTAGALTYTRQYGLVLARGLQVDCWIDVYWSGAAVAPVGDLKIDLPYIGSQVDTNIFVCPIMIDGIALTLTYAGLELASKSKTASLIEYGSGAAAQALSYGVTGDGGFKAYISYLMERDLARH